VISIILVTCCGGGLEARQLNYCGHLEGVAQSYSVYKYGDDVKQKPALFRRTLCSWPHNRNLAIQLVFSLHLIMRVIQLVITIALLSNQESSGVAALPSPLRGAERRAKSGKTTKKSDGGKATVRNPW
jgi:hypothetical protein